jgi:hypothetical protein
MYGWLETGGAANKHFDQTRMNDVILRTSRIDNNVVIGNSNATNAALYISSNAIGMRTIPNLNYTLDVNGAIKANTSLDMIQANSLCRMTASNIDLKFNNASRVYVDSFGLTRNKLLVTNEVKTRSVMLRNTMVYDVYPSDFNDNTNMQVTGWTLEIDTNLSKYIMDTVVLNINSTMYYVVNTDVTTPPIMKVNIIYYFPDQQNISQGTLTFSPGDILDVEVLEDLYKTNKVEPVYIPMVLNDYSYRDNVFMQLAVTLTDLKNISFLNRRALYHIKTTNSPTAVNRPFDNIFLLTDFYFLNETILYLQFRSVDNITPIDAMAQSLFMGFDSSNPRPLYVYILDAIYPKSFRELDVIWGFFTAQTGVTYMSLRDTELIGMVNLEANKTNVLENITFNSLINFDVETMFLDPTEGLLILLRDFDSQYVYAERGNIQYTYIGCPVQILDAEFIGDYTIRYFITNVFNFFSDLKQYEDQFVYVVDRASRIWKLTKVMIMNSGSYIELGNVSGEPFSAADTYLVNPRYIYMVPFKYLSLYVIGNFKDNCYIHNSVGVGTNLISERLTVKGNASVNNELRWYDDESENIFYQRFTAEMFDINNKLIISTSNLVANKDLTVHGVVTANDFMSVSDKRLKKDLVAADPNHDLNVISQINIHNFKFKDEHQYGGKQKKGVIAQELELTLPHVVCKSEGFIPLLYKYGKANKSRKLVLHHVRADIFAQLKEDSLLRISRGHTMPPQWIDSKIKHIVYKPDEEVLFITLECCEVFDVGERIFVYGPYSPYKTVDKDYLFMTAINAIKALKSQMDDLRCQR